MNSKDIFDEDWTFKKVITLVVILLLTGIPSHYMYCKWKGGDKHTPRSCKVVTKIVNFATGMK